MSLLIEETLARMEVYAGQHKVPIINENGRRVFIKQLQDLRPRRVLEIGTAIGYSALLTCLYGDEQVQITSLEVDEERAHIAKQFIAEAGCSNKINIIIGDAGINIMNLPVSEKFDMVFIDAAKGQYPDYWRKIMPLLADKCTVIADNVLFRGYVLGDTETPRRYKTIVKRLREYLDLTKQAEGFSTNIYENGDGLAVSKKYKKDLDNE